MSASVAGDGELAICLHVDKQAQAKSTEQRQAELDRTIGAINALVAAATMKPKRPKPPRRTPDGQSIN